ncbi:MAG: RnfH family protein [Lysobacter sp.]|nr:RnfH family protein [Lysobacter sp.]MDQ3269853.1 RnfH family protein [Pseudomonadota bacterium]
MKVQVLRSWPRRFSSVDLELPESATVIDAVRAAGLHADAEIVAYAVFGSTVDPGHRLTDGDRVELLRSLQADPKDARRSRAQLQRRI